MNRVVLGRSHEAKGYEESAHVLSGGDAPYQVFKAKEGCTVVSEHVLHFIALIPELDKLVVEFVMQMKIGGCLLRKFAGSQQDCVTSGCLPLGKPSTDKLGQSTEALSRQKASTAVTALVQLLIEGLGILTTSTSLSHPSLKYPFPMR
jgi:hypothetical protein